MGKSWYINMRSLAGGKTPAMAGKVKIILCFILILNGSFQRLNIFAQNLVPNFSFETVTNCDSIGAGIFLGTAPPWDAGNTGSPDLLNLCSTNPNADVPLNGFGYQYPHSGNGYAGAAFYELGDNTFREYLQVQLDSVLVIQHKYCVTFYVSLSKALASNNIGIYFSNTHTLISGTNRLNFTPQILDTSIVSDTTGWTPVIGEYVATGGEQYIIIGNFNTAATTSAFSVSGGGESYYYIDDVSIWDCTGSGLGITDASESLDLKISPNPTNGLFTINTSGIKMKEVKVMNILGEVVFRTTAANPQITIDLSNQAKGIYFVEVGNERKKIVKE